MDQQIKYNILLADDHAIIRNGLQFLIANLKQSLTFFHASNRVELFQELNRTPVDLLILDIFFEDRNAITWLQEIKTKFSQIKIIIFTSFDEAIYKNRVLSLGATAFISKLSKPEEIVFLIEKILLEDHTHNHEDYCKKVSVLSILSAREMEIALMLIKGYGNIEISNELNIKSSTISTYKQRIQEKLKLNSLPELIEIFKVNQGSI